MATRFDNLIQEEEKKQENPFSKSKHSLQGADSGKQGSIKKEEYVPPRPSLASADNLEHEETESSRSKKMSKDDIEKLFSGISKKKRSVAKTFYMDESNYKKLEKIANLQKISVSKALNEILSKLL